MKKILFTLLCVISVGLLFACGQEGSTIEFTTNIPATMEVGDALKVVAKDSEDKAIADSKVTVTVKSGTALTVTGLNLKAAAEGEGKIEVKVVDGESSGSKEFTVNVSKKAEQGPVYGLPVPELGYYMKEAAVIEESNGDRLLVYITNAESGEEDDVIAIRKGVKDSTGYVYGDEEVIIEPSASGWDMFIGSPSIVKGEFKYNAVDYSYLIAYQGTKKSSLSANHIGFAVANDPLGDWVKVGNAPVLEFDEPDSNSLKGLYAPSLINLDKESVVRVFYTWADLYGHFSYFVDIDCSDLGSLDVSGYAMVPNYGNLSSGDDVLMMPNCDYAYDSVAKKFYMIKDRSPAAGTNPKVADRIELGVIAEEELYSIEKLNGWTSLRLYDFSDTPDLAYERLYAGALVTDVYGHLLDGDIEIVYNICDVEADNADYIFSQRFESFIFSE